MISESKLGHAFLRRNHSYLDEINIGHEMGPVKTLIDLSSSMCILLFINKWMPLNL